MFHRGEQPPRIDGPLVQAFVRRVTPSCLPRAVLSKGIQHPDALVHHTTLCTLLKLLQTLKMTCQTLQTAIYRLSDREPRSADNSLPHSLQAQDLAPNAREWSAQDSDVQAQHSDFSTGFASAQLKSANMASSEVLDSVAELVAEALREQQLRDTPYLTDAHQQLEPSLPSQWTEFVLQLQQAIRARLPDPQSLLALLATLHRGSTQTATTAVAAAIAADSAQLGGESELLSQVPEADSAALQGQNSMTAQELTSTMLVMVLNAYQSCLPAAMSDSHIDVASLLPQVRINRHYLSIANVLLELCRL